MWSRILCEAFVSGAVKLPRRRERDESWSTFEQKSFECKRVGLRERERGGNARNRETKADWGRGRKSLMDVRVKLTLGVNEARFHLQSSPAVVRKIRVLNDGNCSSRVGNEVRRCEVRNQV